MDIERIKALNIALKALYREETEEKPRASVTEALGVLIESVRFIFDYWESERSE